MYSHFFGLYGMALLDWSCSASGKLGPHRPFALGADNQPSVLGTRIPAIRPAATGPSAFPWKSLRWIGPPRPRR